MARRIHVKVSKVGRVLGLVIGRSKDKVTHQQTAWIQCELGKARRCMKGGGW